MTSVDRHARKQVLLARIAFSRDELRRDIAQIQHAAQPAQLLRAVVGDSLGGGLGRAMGGLFGAGSRRPADWLGTAMGWLSRYRVATTLLGSAIPLLKGRGLHRLLSVAALVGAGWLGWRALSSRRRQP